MKLICHPSKLVKEGKVERVMCAYNRLKVIPAVEVIAC